MEEKFYTNPAFEVISNLFPKTDLSEMYKFFAFFRGHDWEYIRQREGWSELVKR